jgi:hypothetical protein
MRIAILEHNPAGKSATGVRGRAIHDFLKNHGHDVQFVSPPEETTRQFAQHKFSLWSRVRRRLSGGTLPHLWDYLADKLEPKLRRESFDAVIARGQDLAYVLTRDLPGLKILDMANVLFLESYYSWGANRAEVEDTYEKEVRVWKAVDYIVSPHEILTNYFIEHLRKVGDFSGKTITARLGCDPVSRTANFANPPRLVYAGSYYYIQDPYLLARLAQLSPYLIDCYGPEDPNRSFLPATLNYKGYEPGTGFLADYQLGLITVSRDDLRQHSPSTKFPYYFAHGLPVLFPEWMKEGYEYPDCAVPFNERNFVEVVKQFSNAAMWKQMSDAAQNRARDLSWDRALELLNEILRPNSPVKGSN